MNMYKLAFNTPMGHAFYYVHAPSFVEALRICRVTNPETVKYGFTAIRMASGPEIAVAPDRRLPPERE